MLVSGGLNADRASGGDARAVVNAKSERIATQMQARQWAEGQIHVSVERLIAQAPKEIAEEPVPEQKPQINPMPRRSWRGEDQSHHSRNGWSVKHVRPGAGSGARPRHACTGYRTAQAE